MQEKLLNVLNLLRKSRIKYAIHGGFAVGYYTEPRATRDVDLIVMAQDIDKLKNILPYEMRREGDRYVIEAEPMYFEIWGAVSEHDIASLKRRVAKKVMIGDKETVAHLLTPEDLIIKKLDRFSYKDRVDIDAILSSVNVDKKYIRKWIVLRRDLMRKWREFETLEP
ncbi:MAG: hypothetical protein HY930_05855 [Euryarchaeota archaeon]|nr:hypothetical protein [Euryarchaeota archaeon]